MAPTPFTVTRSTEISAPAGVVHALIDDFHEWQSWSPWEGSDPDLQRTYEGPTSGVGATYRWSGNRKAGAGAMSITESDVPRHVTIGLEFTRPFKSVSTVQFTLQENGATGTTTVEWSMSGANAGLSKVFSVFVPMDRLVGKDFQRGLRQLAARAESAGTP